jgi:regulator of protease activity HflC (stomatin/prohibitin superfamily)
MIRFGGPRRWYWFWVPRRWPGKVKLLILVTLVLVLLLANRIFYIIPAGQVGVLFSPFWGGTRTDIVMHEGLQIVWPWKDIYVYDHRMQSRKFAMNTLVESTMQVNMEIVVYFQIVEKNAPYLHKSVGPNYVELMVEPMVRSEVREVMGRVSLETVRNSDTSELEWALISQLNEAAGEHQVEVDGVTIRENLVDFKRIVINSLTIPNSVNQAVNWKEQQQQYLLGSRYILERIRVEAEQRQVEAEGIAAANRLINASLTAAILNWRNIEAIEALARSANSKVVVLGANGKETPVILGSDVLSQGTTISTTPAPGSAPQSAEPKPPDHPDAAKPPDKSTAPLKPLPFHSRDNDAFRHVPTEKPAISPGHTPHPTPPNPAPRDTEPRDQR